MRKILFVDDDPLVGMMTTMALRRMGHAVESFTSGAPALEAFRRDPQAWDLVISDIHLGPECGFDLCRSILETRPGMPVIMASGLVESRDIEMGHSIGASGVLPKSEVVTGFPQLLRRFFD
jgi:DNA-binding response OmpR family regulator